MKTLCIAAAFMMLAPAALAQQEASAERGAAAYAESCAECHRSAERLAGRLDGEAEAVRERLDRFLTEHHAPEAGARADIVAYLLSL